MRVVAFSDIHGDLESFKKAINFIRGLDNITYILIAGDISDWRGPEHADEVYKNLVKMFQLLEKLNIKYFFVLGNWDTFFTMDFIESTKMKLNPVLLFQTILKEAKAKKGVLLRGSYVYELNQYVKLTTDPKLVNKKTIFLTHAYPKPITNVLMHIEGHWGLYAQLNGNYLNLGFLHGGREKLTGLVWTIELEKDKVTKIQWYDLGGMLKEYVCPFHRNEGLFIIPSNWKKCPVCYKPERARFS